MSFGRNLRAERKLPKDFEQHPAAHWDFKAETYRLKSLAALNSRQRQYAIEQMIICQDAAALIKKGQ